jgi:hypothetical protein
MKVPHVDRPHLDRTLEFQCVRGSWLPLGVELRVSPAGVDQFSILAVRPPESVAHKLPVVPLVVWPEDAGRWTDPDASFPVSELFELSVHALLQCAARNESDEPAHENAPEN